MAAEDPTEDGPNSGSQYRTEPFVPEFLKDFPHLFSNSELNALAKWGRRAAELNDGSVDPANEREMQFVRVCKGKAAPIGAAQCLWLRYVSARSAQDRLDKLSQLGRNLAESLARAQEVQDENRRLRLAHSTVWKQNEELNKRINRRATAESKSIFELQKLVQEYEDRLGIQRTIPAKPIPSVSEDWGNDWREQK